MLTNRNVVKRDGGDYLLLGYQNLTPDQVQRLKTACELQLSEYVSRRGDAILEHRIRGLVPSTYHKMDSPRRFTFPLGKSHKPTCRCGRCYAKREIRTLIREHRLPGFRWDAENERFVAQKVPICFAGPVRGIN